MKTKKQPGAPGILSWPIVRVIGVAAVAVGIGMLSFTSITTNAQAPATGETAEAGEEGQGPGETRTCGRIWRECADLVFEYEKLIGDSQDKVQNCSYNETTNEKDGSKTVRKVDQGCYDSAMNLMKDLMASREKNANKCEKRRVDACQ